MQLDERLDKSRIAVRTLGGAIKLATALVQKVEEKRNAVDFNIRAIRSLKMSLLHATHKAAMEGTQCVVQAAEQAVAIAEFYGLPVTPLSFLGYHVSSRGPHIGRGGHKVSDHLRCLGVLEGLGHLWLMLSGCLMKGTVNLVAREVAAQVMCPSAMQG